jgi:hypothetical protein
MEIMTLGHLVENHDPCSLGGKSRSSLGEKFVKSVSSIAQWASAKSMSVATPRTNPKAELHGRMARGGDGLPKVSTAPAMPYPSMPYG